METFQKAFIAKPYFYKNENDVDYKNPGIKYPDVLTYIALRSFHNSKTGRCFPSLKTIAKRAGVSKKFATKSIERLQNAKFINISKAPERSRLSNIYHFPKFRYFDRIPLEIFDHEELSLYEKGMLLCLRELAITPTDIVDTIPEIVQKLSSTYSTVSTQLQSLISKGFVSENEQGGFKLRRIDWNYSTITEEVIPKPNFSFILS